MVAIHHVWSILVVVEGYGVAHMNSLELNFVHMDKPHYAWRSKLSFCFLLVLLLLPWSFDQNWGRAQRRTSCRKRGVNSSWLDDDARERGKRKREKDKKEKERREFMFPLRLHNTAHHFFFLGKCVLTSELIAQKKMWFHPGLILFTFWQCDCHAKAVLIRNQIVKEAFLVVLHTQKKKEKWNTWSQLRCSMLILEWWTVPRFCWPNNDRTIKRQCT